jgi:holo-[acyl-carrier protein] synthase
MEITPADAAAPLVTPFGASAPVTTMDIQLPPGGILVGLGADIIEVERVQGVLERQGERFLNRVFTDEERAYCSSMKFPHKHYAARFAAKEAVSKCFSTGIGAELGWRSISIYHGPRHQPLVRLDDKGAALLRHVGATHVHVTLSHTDTMAMAVAALIRA